MSTPTSHITSVYNYVSAQEDVTIAGAAADGVNVNRLMVEEGFAVPFTKS